MHSSIFRAYDIRGIYPSELNEDDAFLIARGLAVLLQGENPGKRLKLAIGRDMRVSGEAIHKKVVQALLEAGIDVDDFGIVSTPTFYFGVAYFGYDGGVQISASHNPKEWNGLKMVRRGAASLSKNSGIAAIQKLVEEGGVNIISNSPGTYGNRSDVLEKAVQESRSLAQDPKIKPLKIVIDAANGMGAEDMKALFATLPCEVVQMNFALDGNFPVHEADPMKPENRKLLSDRVAAEGADLGIAPDGDGDRYFFIDERGETVSQSAFFALMAHEELREKPGGLIPYDVRPARVVRDVIEASGGRTLLTPAGSALIKEAMVREGAIFSGEPTGHYFHQTPWGTFEAPMLLILKFLRVLSERNQKVSELVAPFVRYAYSGDINIRVQNQGQIPETLHKVRAAYADGLQPEIDGVSVEYPNYWFNVRPSNTEPLVRINMEAIDQNTLEGELIRLRELVGE